MPDAYTIGIVDHGEEGPANSARIIAYRIGLIAAGGGLLLLPNQIGWTDTFGVAAALMAVMAAGVFACPRVEVPLEARRDVWGAFGSWKGRGGVVLVLCFVLLYRVGDIGMAPMLKPLPSRRCFLPPAPCANRKAFPNNSSATGLVIASTSCCDAARRKRTVRIGGCRRER